MVKTYPRSFPLALAKAGLGLTGTLVRVGGNGSRDGQRRGHVNRLLARPSVPSIGVGLSGMYLSLSSSGPVKWNHNQETSLFQDVSPFSPAYDGRSTATLGEKVRELYLQFLWLPEVRVCYRSVWFSQILSMPFLVCHAIESICQYGSNAREAFGDRSAGRCAPAPRSTGWHLAYREVV